MSELKNIVIKPLHGILNESPLFTYKRNKFGLFDKIHDYD